MNKGNKTISSIMKGSKPVIAIMKGLNKVYEAIKLPDEYQRVSWIQSTTNQHTDFFIVTSNDVGSIFTWECEIAWDSLSSRQLMGGNDPMYWGINASGYYECGTASKLKATIGKFDKVVYDITQMGDHRKKQLYINGEIVVDTYNSTAYQGAKNFSLFNYGWGSFQCYSKVKYFKFYDNRELIAHLIPCYRKSDNKTGMYDVIKNIFHENKGTDEFILG